MIHKDEVLDYVSSHNFEVLIVLGAGDLDNQVPQITKLLNSKIK
jgi:UDP-N-acetylmuramate--alanine ligase